MFCGTWKEDKELVMSSAKKTTTKRAERRWEVTINLIDAPTHPEQKLYTKKELEQRIRRVFLEGFMGTIKIRNMVIIDPDFDMRQSERFANDH